MCGVGYIYGPTGTRRSGRHSSARRAASGSRRRPSVIQSVDRAVRVLTALQGSRRMALSELATRLELPPSTVHGLVRTLVAHGLVVQERGSTRYQLGPAVLRPGKAHPRTVRPRAQA